MNKDVVSKINSLFKDEKQQLSQLVTFYIQGEIDITDIIQQDSINLKISPQVINRFAVKLQLGKDDLTKSPKFAFTLYEYAGTKGNGSAKRNAAMHYSDPSYGGVEQNIDKAIKLFKEALESKEKVDCHFFLAKAYLKNNALKEAFMYFKLIKSDDKDYASANTFIKEILNQQLTCIYESVIKIPRFTNVDNFCRNLYDLYKKRFERSKKEFELKEPSNGFFAEDRVFPTGDECLPVIEASITGLIGICRMLCNKFPGRKIHYQRVIRLLQHEFAKVKSSDANPIPELKELKLEEKMVSQPKGWLPLSPVLDGYNFKLIHEPITDMELKSLEYDMAMQAVSLAQSRLNKAKQEKLPLETVQALEKKLSQLQTQKGTTQNKYEQLEQNYNDLVNGAELKELKRQTQTEKHFFSPHRTNKPQPRELALSLQKNRITDKKEDIQTLTLDQTPARRLITAEISTIEASLKIYGRSEDEYGTDFGWHVDNSEQKTGSYKNYEIKHGNTEKVKLDNTEIRYRQRVNPHYDHLGDYYMYDLGDYSKIISVINSMTGTNDETVAVENEKKLAKYMLEFSQYGRPINLANNLKEINPDATEDDIKKIDRIFYHCFVKEPARWMLPKTSSHELPFATAQIRAIKLIAHGHLSMKEVFDQHALYGVFTGKEIGKKIEEVREKIKRINHLYTEVFLKISQKYFHKHIEFFKSHENGQLVTTRKELHRELKEAYGGDSDTDEEGYDSDTANKLYPGAFEF